MTGFLIPSRTASITASVGKPYVNPPASYSSIASLQAATVSASSKILRIDSYYTGDAPTPFYVRRVASQPAHAWRFRSVDRFLPDGSTNSLNGGWWEGVHDGCEVNIKWFGAKGDGSTIDSDAFGAVANYFQGSHLVLKIPPGSYRAPTNANLASKAFSGCESVTFNADGASFTQDSLIYPFAAAYEGSGHIESYIATANTGDTTITLSTIGEATSYAAGNWIAVTAYDMQGYGWPPNQAFFEYVKIAAVNTGTGVITLMTPLTNSYKSTYPHYSSGDPSTFVPSLGGPAMIYKLTAGWDMEVIVNGMTFNQPNLAQMYMSARYIEFNRCKFIGAVAMPAPTSSQKTLFRGCHFEGGQTEVDKGLSELIYEDCYFSNNVNIQSAGSLDRVLLNRCRGKTISGSGLNVQLEDCTFQTVALGPGYGYTKSASLLRCNVKTLSLNAQKVPFSAINSITNGVISVKISSGGYAITIPGSVFVFSVGNSPWGVPFRVIDVTPDGAGNLLVETTLPASVDLTANSLGTPDGIMAWANSIRVQESVGGEAVEALSRASTGEFRPWASSSAVLFDEPLKLSNPTAGHIGKTLNMFGYVDKITVNVIKPYAGVSATATMRLGYGGGVLLMGDTGGTALSTFNPIIDLKTVGLRTLSPSGISGSVGADSLSAWPSGKNFLVQYFRPAVLQNFTDDDCLWPIVEIRACTHLFGQSPTDSKVL
jgi:hypothetical protein